METVTLFNILYLKTIKVKNQFFLELMETVTSRNFLSSEK